MKTTFQNIRQGKTFRKVTKSNPKENEFFIKTSKESAAYCEKNGRIISNHFLLASNLPVIQQP